MKRIMMMVLALVLTLTLAVAAIGCGGQAQSNAPAPTAAGSGRGDTFQAGGETYMLHKIVRLPDYDTDTTKGYGVVVLKKSNKAPFRFTMNAKGAGTPVSLIDVVLDGENGVAASKNIVFGLSTDDKRFLGYARFEFSLPSSADFPETGTFVFSGNAKEKHPLRFEGMKIE